MNTLDYLADTCLDSSLVAKISHILASLANDYASFLGRDNGSQSELRFSILFVRLGEGFSIRADASIITTSDIDIIQAICKLIDSIVAILLGCRHLEWTAMFVCVVGG